MEISSVTMPVRGMDNQNTNQNEASRASACSELDLTTESNAVEISTVQTQDSNEDTNEAAKSRNVPLLVVTAPSDNEMSDDEPTQEITVPMDEINIEKTSTEDLGEEDRLLDHNGVDTASDDEFEVICRCSSTPVSANNDSVSSISSPKCGMPSIEETSPIRKEEERDNDSPGKEDSAIAQSQGVVYVQSQYYTHSQQSVSDAPQEYSHPQLQNNPAYDLGSVVTFAQQAPVYSVNGTTITYAAGQQTPAVSFSSYQDTACHTHIPNGYYGNYVPRSDQNPGDGAHHAEANNQSNLTCGGHAQEDPRSMYPQSPMSEVPNFVYPSIYVSNAGLISVLLRHDMSVEMTVDRTIRVVSHQHMMAVATDSRGTSACLYHPVLKVMQQGTTTDIATDSIRVHMSHNEVAFALGSYRYRFDAHDVQPAAQFKFSDISKDQSVNLLFSSEGYGENLVPQCLEVASKAEYANLPKGGVIVRINGVKVTQNGGGDVTVVTGAKFIRLSPFFGMTRLGNRFIDIEIERDWSCRVSRGPHCFLAGDRRVLVSNGKLEVGINEQGRFKVTQLQQRRPATPQQCLRPEQFARRVNSVTCNNISTGRPAIMHTPPSRRRSAPVGISR